MKHLQDHLCTIFPIVLLTVVTTAAVDPELSHADFVPVWEEHIYRPHPAHFRYDPTIIPDSKTISDLNQQPESGEASTSNALPSFVTISQHPIPAFRDASGREWGPFELNPIHFQALEYPLSMRELEHLSKDHNLPGDVTSNGPPTFSLASRRSLPSAIRPVVFNPQPEILTQISEVIQARLAKAGIPLDTISHDNPLQQGTYLPPPLRRTQNGLEFPSELLEGRYSEILYHRIRHPSPEPTLFTFPVAVGGRIRYVLAATAKPAPHTPMRWGTRTTSTLWLFYEPRYTRSVFSGEPMQRGVSLLGAMFLPKFAEDALVQSGVLIAYPSLRRGAR
ncbi:hypothetical protein PHSY_001999 [Pseudozyma hubeiensis SY62]|uniref:Uncharacterized protein n=1 Tax=Pseudozyma hubeiensis (strain SY62) TaxID=1305764 RepID=R9NZU9_PSEHS|nr:hypothetical protein PHSY_001999 [Pseudozyma hubeiensis SY62]GAC94428.1 hypothetical protein PHSY_001999 [Pseudozyma hubeiensis SY62]